MKLLLTSLLVFLWLIPANAQKPTSIPPGSKVYVAPMKGFEDYFIAALRKKSVPLLVVANKDQADFEVTGSSESKGAGWAKILVMGDLRSSEKASFKIVNLHTGVVAFADSSNRGSAWRGTRSTAEKLAKYLKKHIEDDQAYMAAHPGTTPLATPLANAFDLNDTWKYQDSELVVVQDGRNVKISQITPGMCNGTPAPYFINGVLEGSKLTGKMVLCTHEKLFSSCGMAATSEVDFSGTVNGGAISGMATIPGMMMNTTAGGRCTGTLRDEKRDTQYPLVLSKTGGVTAVAKPQVVVPAAEASPAQSQGSKLEAPSFTPAPAPQTPAEPTYTGGTVQVRGYYRKDGTYVRPHTRSAPSRRH